MTIELSSHVLSFNKKLFLSVISLFIAFAICFMAFQYRREKEYKIELLNTQLQNYNDRLNDFLRGRGYAEYSTIGRLCMRTHL